MARPVGGGTVDQLGHPLDALALGISRLVRAAEQGHSGPITDLEPGNAAVLESMWRAVDTTPRDWLRSARQAVDFHLRNAAAIHGALERHFGVKLAFQNCCKIAAFTPAAVDGPVYRKFISPRAQILNQSTELRNC